MTQKILYGLLFGVGGATFWIPSLILINDTFFELFLILASLVILSGFVFGGRREFVTLIDEEMTEAAQDAGIAMEEGDGTWISKVPWIKALAGSCVVGGLLGLSFYLALRAIRRWFGGAEVGIAIIFGLVALDLPLCISPMC